MVPRGPKWSSELDTYREALKHLKNRWNRLLSRHPWSFLRQTQTITTGPGTPGTPHVVDLGGPVVSVYSASLTDSASGGRLAQVPQHEIDARDPGRQRTGRPEVYSQLWGMSGANPGSKIEIWPIPSSSVTLRIRTIRYEPPPSALSDTSALPFDAALVYGIAADMARVAAARSATENPKLAGVYMAFAKEMEGAWNEAVLEMIEVDSSRPTVADTGLEAGQYYSYGYYPDADWP